MPGRGVDMHTISGRAYYRLVHGVSLGVSTLHAQIILPAAQPSLQMPLGHRGLIAQ
jgi:hypothetical protein